MAKAYSVRGLCYYICYSAEDLATHFGVHIQTVREWVRKGLSPIDNNKPALFMGAAVIQFIYGSGNSTLNTHISHSPQQTDFMEQMTHEHA